MNRYIKFVNTINIEPVICKYVIPEMSYYRINIYLKYLYLNMNNVKNNFKLIIFIKNYIFRSTDLIHLDGEKILLREKIN